MTDVAKSRIHSVIRDLWYNLDRTSEEGHKINLIKSSEVLYTAAQFNSVKYISEVVSTVQHSGFSCSEKFSFVEVLVGLTGKIIYPIRYQR